MQVVGLPAADIGRIGSREVEIGAEYVVAHLGIDFAQPHAIVGVLPFSVGPDEPEYDEAKRLLKFLDYFLPIPADDIPNSSLIREFIGGGCFDV